MQYVLTGLIGLVAVYIAYRQWRTANYRLKLDLYDRRYAIYLGTRDFISHIYEKMGVDADARIAFIRVITGSRFLFGSDFADFLHSLLKNAHELHLTRVKLRLAIDVANADKATSFSRDSVISLSDDETKLTDWITEQEANLAERFLPYLDFQKVK